MKTKKTLVYAIIAFFIVSCSGRPKEEIKTAEELMTKDIAEIDTAKSAGAKSVHSTMDGESFCNSIIDPDLGIYKATITDADMLVIAVRPIGNPNFDYVAQSYLESAISSGVMVKGCLVVDVDKSEFQKGAVIGDRIGKAYR